jgi:hypothetical protein
MTSPPNSSFTGSHTVLVRKEKPYLSIAGQALIVKEVSMAKSRSRVHTAAALATQPKIRSARGPDRAFFLGGGEIFTSDTFRRASLEGVPPCVRVVDMGSFSGNL